MILPPKRIIDVRGRLWERKNGSLYLSNCDQIFRPRGSIIKNFTITEDSRLFYIPDRTFLDITIPGEVDPVRIRRISDVHCSTGLAIVTEDNRGFIYDYRKSKMYEDPFIDITYIISHWMMGEIDEETLIDTQTIVIGIDNRVRLVNLHDDGSRSIDDLGFEINADEIIDVIESTIITKNCLNYIDNYEKLHTTECNFDIVSASWMEDGRYEAVVLDSNGLVSQPYKNTFPPNNLLSNELDDWTPWRELFKLGNSNYIGIVNQSGKAYAIDRNYCIGRVDIPREIFIKPKMTKSARTKI